MSIAQWIMVGFVVFIAVCGTILAFTPTKPSRRMKERKDVSADRLADVVKQRKVVN